MARKVTVAWDLTRPLVGNAVEPVLKLVDRVFHRNRDKLTGMMPHDELVRRLERSVKDIRSGKLRNVAVYYIDINEFKLFNDNYGHYAANQVLVRMAKLISDFTAGRGYASRVFGGDEFVVVLHNVGTDARSIVEGTKLNSLLTGEYDLGENSLPVTVSIGVEVCDKRMVPLRQARQAENQHMSIVDHADYAMIMGRRHRHEEGDLGDSFPAVYRFSYDAWEKYLRKVQFKSPESLARRRVSR